MKSYFQFNRYQLAEMYSLSTALKLTTNEITQLKEINEDLSLKEVSEIYLPISHLLNIYYYGTIHRKSTLHQINNNIQRIPYIISISGSVAVGKSTTAHILQKLLSRWPNQRRVELITTDGFLYTNQVLKERNLMKKKGFPQSYDIHQFMKFIFDLKSGVPIIRVPVYSHFIYDIIPNINKIIKQPDILILEGLNIMQQNFEYDNNQHYFSFSDFVDFSIYIDAKENFLKTWYINRFLKIREKAFSDPNSYFHHYCCLTKQKAIDVAISLWNEINYINLKKNILPTREQASLIITKKKDHAVEQIRIRS